MKFIFDFDGVLFNAKEFIKFMYDYLEKTGTPRSITEEYYKKVGGTQFGLKEMLSHFSIDESFYEKILNESPKFNNKELLDVVNKLGKENCYIVSHAKENWQRDKISKTGIGQYFSEIYVVSESKKGAVEALCKKHEKETVVFVDDKAKYFENLDFEKYPNLKTILYDDQGLEKLKREIK